MVHGGDGPGDLRAGQQGVFDFAQLDAVATDFDLLVGAARLAQLPVGAQRTRSPVRYMRAPGHRTGTPRTAAGQPRRPTYPRHTAPATYSSPTTPAAPDATSRPARRSRGGQRHPDGTAMGLRVGGDDLAEGGMHRGLGNAIHVDQPRPILDACPANSAAARLHASPPNTTPRSSSCPTPLAAQQHPRFATHRTPTASGSGR